MEKFMARDDYHVIVYQILAYLYTQLKAGEPVNGDYMLYQGWKMPYSITLYGMEVARK